MAPHPGEEWPNGRPTGPAEGSEAGLSPAWAALRPLLPQCPLQPELPASRRAQRGVPGSQAEAGRQHPRPPPQTPCSRRSRAAACVRSQRLRVRPWGAASPVPGKRGDGGLRHSRSSRRPRRAVFPSQEALGSLRPAHRSPRPRRRRAPAPARPSRAFPVKRRVGKGRRGNPGAAVTGGGGGSPVLHLAPYRSPLMSTSAAAANGGTRGVKGRFGRRLSTQGA